MKNQNKVQKPTWKQALINGPAVLVVAAGIAIGVGFTPQFASAQDAENLTFTSPLDGQGCSVLVPPDLTGSHSSSIVGDISF